MLRTRACPAGPCDSRDRIAGRKTGARQTPMPLRRRAHAAVPDSRGWNDNPVGREVLPDTQIGEEARGHRSPSAAAGSAAPSRLPAGPLSDEGVLSAARPRAELASSAWFLMFLPLVPLGTCPPGISNAKLGSLRKGPRGVIRLRNPACHGPQAPRTSRSRRFVASTRPALITNAGGCCSLRTCWMLDAHSTFMSAFAPALSP